jgi:hypothetical protein
METRRLSKLEIFKKQGFVFWVKHPKFREEGSVINTDGRYYFNPTVGRTIELTEKQLVELLDK